MSSVLNSEERQFREACLDLAVEFTGMGLGVYVEKAGELGELTITPNSRSRFESFCKYMHKDPHRKALCEADHNCRANTASDEGLQLCHAGLYNYTVCYQVGSRKVVLIGGQACIEGQEDESEARFNAFADGENLPADERAELLRRLRQAKKIRRRDLHHRLKRPLRNVGNWYARYLDMRRNFEETITNVAHDFQIHVTALRVDADLLCSDLEAPGPIRREMREEARDLFNKIDRLRDVVENHLLGYLEAPRFEYRTIGPIVHGAIEAYRSQASEKGVRIEVDLELVGNRSPGIEMAESYLGRAMHNLVQNAVKYSYHGLADRERVVRVTGRVEPRHSVAGYQISFENFGIGIDEDEHELIFQRGYQGRRTRDEYRPGSGNGLYFAREVIYLHQGQISVQSWDKGSAFLTRFDVWLPYEQPKEQR